MTTLIIEKKVKKYKRVENHLFQTLVLRLPPQPIRDNNRHKAFSEVLEMLAELFAEQTLTGQGKEALETYFGAVSYFVSEYERNIFPQKTSSPENMLEFFMDQFKLKQSDLAQDLGGQPVVSDILNGRRKLNRDQIERLARRFHVSPGTFYGSSAFRVGEFPSFF